MKKHPHQDSFTILLSALVACWLASAALPGRADDLVQLKPSETPGAASASVSNTLGQPIVWTNHLSLRVEPGETTWVAGYVTNNAEQEKAFTNRVSQAAEAGDAEAQVSLALCLHDGRHGFRTNRVQAYKWAAVAASQGHSKAKRLVAEWQASMSTNDVAAGKAAAMAFTPQGKRQQD